jgi:hypothetical protein
LWSSLKNLMNILYWMFTYIPKALVKPRKWKLI